MSLVASSKRISRKKDEFIVAISGGHSASVALAFHPEIGFLGAAPHKGISPHLFPNEMLANEFIKLLDRLAKQLEIDPPELYRRTSRITLSCPGAASERDQALLKLSLEQVFARRKSPHYRIVDDTWAGLVAGALSLQGTCAFGGTGASVYVGQGKKPTGWDGKIDGWGYVIGDFGSGFQLTVDMFREFCRHWNEHKTAPALFQHIDRVIQERNINLPPLRRIEDTQKWFDSVTLIDFRKDWKVDFARLSAAATEAADATDPDPMAVDLVKRTAGEMVRSLEIAFKRCPAARGWPLVFQGGMFENSKLYHSTVTQSVRTMISGKPALARFRPVLGAALLELEALGWPMVSKGKQFIEAGIKDLPPETQQLLIRSRGAGFANS